MVHLHLRSVALAAALSATCVATALASGTADVSFTQPERYADAGDTPAERDANLQVLAVELQSLAARLLPADQALKIEVLDVDLAGRLRPTQRGNLRIQRNDNDPARITLRYTLSANGQVLRTSDAALTSLGKRKPSGAFPQQQPLAEEKSLLDAWFKKEFGAASS